MKRRGALISAGLVFLAAGAFFSFVIAQNQAGERYILDHESDVASVQPGPHGGGGETIACNYFSKAKNCNIVFRKRILHPGSSIGYHLQNANEIYYIVSGAGEMKMNGALFDLKAGDAILTYPGSFHGLTPKGKEDLVVIINYLKGE